MLDCPARRRPRDSHRARPRHAGSVAERTGLPGEAHRPGHAEPRSAATGSGAVVPAAAGSAAAEHAMSYCPVHVPDVGHRNDRRGQGGSGQGGSGHAGPGHAGPGRAWRGQGPRPVGHAGSGGGRAHPVQAHDPNPDTGPGRQRTAAVPRCLGRGHDWPGHGRRVAGQSRHWADANGEVS